MTSQPPLLDSIGTDLPGPLFTPRPGWGGKLRVWLRANGVKTLATLIVVSASIGATSYIINRRDSVSVTPTASPTPIAIPGYTITARTGDTLTSISTRALDDHLKASGEQLDRIARLWAVDRITNALLTPYPARPTSGQVITIPTTVIEYGIAEATSLSPTQRKNLQKYLK